MLLSACVNLIILVTVTASVYNSNMDAEKRSKKYFDGSTDVEAFITIAELNASVKGYADERKAQYLASLLVEGPALNVYLRLDTEKRKNAEEIKTALRTEFEAAHRDREVALAKLAKRKMLRNESPHTFAYALQELTKLAYSTLPAPSQDAIAKDYFVNCQSKEMQTALKSLPDFSTKSMSDLAKEAVRFQTAGVQSAPPTPAVVKTEISEVSLGATGGDALVDNIVDKVVSRLSGMNVAGASGDTSVDYVQRQSRGGGRNRGRNRSNQRGRGSNRGRGDFKCRNCSSPDHGYSKCPTRFCQACGGRGHDGWSRDCPNF